MGKNSLVHRPLYYTTLENVCGAFSAQLSNFLVLAKRKRNTEENYDSCN